MRSVRRARVACDPGCYPVRARNRDPGSLKIGSSGLPRAFGSSWAIRERRRRCAPPMPGDAALHPPKRSPNVRNRGPEFRRVLIQLLIVRASITVDLVKKGSQLFIARNPIGVGNDFFV